MWHSLRDAVGDEWAAAFAVVMFALTLVRTLIWLRRR